MKHKVYTVYDSKSELYEDTFTARARGEALRLWQATVNDGKSKVSRFPGDFTLLEIGEWDDILGMYTMYEAKQNLGLALDVKDKPATVTPLEEAIRKTKEA